MLFFGCFVPQGIVMFGLLLRAISFTDGGIHVFAY
jgi:hypothetical protein